MTCLSNYATRRFEMKIGNINIDQALLYINLFSSPSKMNYKLSTVADAAYQDSSHGCGLVHWGSCFQVSEHIPHTWPCLSRARIHLACPLPTYIFVPSLHTLPCLAPPCPSPPGMHHPGCPQTGQETQASDLRDVKIYRWTHKALQPSPPPEGGDETCLRDRKSVV